MTDTSQSKSKTLTNFIKKVQNTITKFGLLNPNDRVLAAVSGGPDSVAMLRLLLFLQKEYSIDIGIAHLNHMLRSEEADRDEAFVKDLANKLKIPCFIAKKDVAGFAKKNRLSLEDSARELRYSFLKNILKTKKYSKICIGHNSDDDAELILMNILRGSGTKGIKGISPVREKLIIRPLIENSKAEIYNFLDSINQTYVIDSTNCENIYFRNSIRNVLIPMIEEKYNPNIKESLLRLAAIIKDEDDWMEKETEVTFNKTLVNKLPINLNTDTIKLSIIMLKDFHPALKKRIIRKSIQVVNGSLKKISLRHVDDILKLLSSKTSGESIDLPDQIRIFKKNNKLFIKKEEFPLRELGKKRKNEKKI